MLKLNVKCKKGLLNKKICGKVTCANIYIYIFYIVIVYKVQPSVYRKGIQPLESSHYLNPIIVFNSLRVGLSSTELFVCR